MTDVTPDLAPTITDHLHVIAESDDLDSAHIIAQTLNLYHEALRRRASRTTLNANDIQTVFRICMMLLAAADLEQGIAKFIPKGIPTRPQ